ADMRIPLLLQTPAAVRFVSYEPALGPVEFMKWLAPKMIACWKPGYKPNEKDVAAVNQLARAASKRHGCEYLDWLIVGGESGPGARAFDLAWARSAVTQSRGAGVPVFVKQLGARPRAQEGVDFKVSRMPKVLGDGTAREAADGLFVDPRGNLSLRDRKGGDWSEWPEDLRVRQFPVIVEAAV